MEKFDIKILVKVLPNIIRSSFGAFFGAGLIQFTSLIFSGLFPLKASSLLLATNIIRTGIQLANTFIQQASINCSNENIIF